MTTTLSEINSRACAWMQEWRNYTKRGNALFLLEQMSRRSHLSYRLMWSSGYWTVEGSSYLYTAESVGSAVLHAWDGEFGQHLLKDMGKDVRWLHGPKINPNEASDIMFDRTINSMPFDMS